MLEKFGSTPQREAYILMERINALPEKNYLIKAGLPCELSDVISELGIYGVYIGLVFIDEILVNLYLDCMIGFYNL